MPTLYTHPMSTFAQRVHIALTEKGVSWDHEIVDMVAGAHRGPAHLELHPYGKVPVLVDGDLTLYESTAILEYLEELHPEPPLMPEGAADRARVRQFIKAGANYFVDHVGTLIFPKRFMPKEKWREDAMAKASKHIAKHYAVLDRALEGKDYLVAERFTLAEVAYAPMMLFAPLYDVEQPANVARWSAKLLARPSVIATRPADAKA